MGLLGITSRHALGVCIRRIRVAIDLKMLEERGVQLHGCIYPRFSRSELGEVDLYSVQRVLSNSNTLPHLESLACDYPMSNHSFSADFFNDLAGSKALQHLRLFESNTKPYSVTFLKDNQSTPKWPLHTLHLDRVGGCQVEIPW